MQSLEELAPIDQHLEKQHQEKTKVKNINVVEMGKFEMDTWYFLSLEILQRNVESLSVLLSIPSYKYSKTCLPHQLLCSPAQQALRAQKLACVLLRRYYSPYPEPYASCEKLYVCEFTMKYFRKAKSLERHLARLQTRQPPGQSVVYVVWHLVHFQQFCCDCSSMLNP